MLFVVADMAVAASYDFSFLPLPEGALRANVTAINNSGQIISRVKLTDFNEHTFLTSNGTVTDLGYTVLGQDINNLGQILDGANGGRILTDTGVVTLQAPADHSMANVAGLNDHGQVAGSIYAGYSSGSTPVMWSTAGMTSLLTANMVSGSAQAINNLGQVALNYSTLDDATSHAGIWSNNTLIELGTNADVLALNDKGQAVGLMGIHAALWNGTTYTDLGTLGGDFSAAIGINNRGQIIGNSTTMPNNWIDHAVLWDESGNMIDLDQFIPSELLAQGLIPRLRAINDDGVIIGDITNQEWSNPMPFMLTPTAAPVPEPTMTSLWILGLACGLGLAYRKQTAKA
ncbi:hypothetical protein JY96_17835 [Aquabacterium sp. NJ1]|nr:hypothetical protein JY96_17835 [Aquabacterium sp. NJ1]